VRIAVNTGGGDAPGLNAVIRAFTLGALRRGWEVVGIRRGYDGLFMEDGKGIIPLDEERVRGITHLGGTILGTTNRGDPLAVENGHDRGVEIVKRIHDLGCDGLIAIGGDGSLTIAGELQKRGLKVIGVPKTIDNDLAATTVTFGFHTAVQTATDAIGRLHSTAEAHRRTMVVEVMGRDAGWIGLFAGLGGTADVILIPEIPFDFDRVCEAVDERYTDGPEFAIVVVSEGARPIGGEVEVVEEVTPGRPRYGGIAEFVASQITERTGYETRSLVLGHIQRGGEPTAYDKVLALRFGAAAVELAARGDWGSMVALDPPDIHAVPLAEATAKLKLVQLDSDIVQTARSLGVSFGD
jgi:6-phosphofructokinase 1